MARVHTPPDSFIVASYPFGHCWTEQTHGRPERRGQVDTFQIRHEDLDEPAPAGRLQACLGQSMPRVPQMRRIRGRGAPR